MGDKIAIMGAGALGGHVGGYLARHGHDVTLIDPWPEHVEHMRAHGLTLRGETAPENFTTPVTAIHLTELQAVSKSRAFDFAFVSMKSYDTVWATQMIAQYLTPDGFVVSLQNSINEERIASVVGWGKTVGCIASTIAVELLSPGLVRRNVGLGGTRHTVFRVGEPHGRITSRIEKIAAMLSVADSAKTTTNLWGERWSKLVLNGMVNGVSSATGLPIAAVNVNEAVRRFTIQLGGEAVRIGQALGYELEEIGRFEPEELALASEGDPEALAKVDGILAKQTSSNPRDEIRRPSMAQDVLKGRRTEIEFINGYIAAKGEEIGIDAPSHRRVTELVRGVERGTVTPSPAHLGG